MVFRKPRPDVTVANVVWRVAPLVGTATGILHIAIFFAPPDSPDKPSFFGVTVLAFAGVGVVWGSLRALGAVTAYTIARIPPPASDARRPVARSSVSVR